jgi:hypothetical protein
MRKRKKMKFEAYEFAGTREDTEAARARVVRAARENGYITNAQARVVGRWRQAWYHLHALYQAGLLRKDGFNRWVPRKQKKKR